MLKNKKYVKITVHYTTIYINCIYFRHVYHLGWFRTTTPVNVCILCLIVLCSSVILFHLILFLHHILYDIIVHG